MTIELGKIAAEAILFDVNEAWLAKRGENILEPELPIIDPHHHLWDRGSRYLFDEVLKDISSGHKVLATVYLQCDSMYRKGGNRLMAPVGETEFVNGIAAMSASGLYGQARICAGIVGFADLTQGAGIEPLLAAHLKASSRFRGVRYCSVWDADASIKSTPMDFPRELLLDARFREGFALLARYGLSFDSWIYHTQIPELADLARKFPDTTIVLDHIGAPLAVGVYAGKGREVFAKWRENIRQLPPVPMPASSLAASACICSAFTSKSETPRHRQRIWPKPGAPSSRPASKRSVRIVACSRATSRSTSARAATWYYGTPSNAWRRDIPTARKPHCSARRRAGFID
jgi:L-fuconolactonase